MASGQVSWFEVYTFAERYAASRNINLDNLPLPGTPSWCGMRDDDARKLMALVLGGVREALANDARQEQLAGVSHEVAQAAKWISDQNRFVSNRGKSYIRRSA